MERPLERETHARPRPSRDDRDAVGSVGGTAVGLIAKAQGTEQGHQSRAVAIRTVLRKDEDVRCVVGQRRGDGANSLSTSVAEVQADDSQPHREVVQAAAAGMTPSRRAARPQRQGTTSGRIWWLTQT